MPVMTDVLDQTLDELRGRLPQIRAVHLVSEEGFPISSITAPDSETDFVTAASLFGSVASMAGSSLEETKQAPLRQITLEGERGITMITQLANGQTLTVIASPDLRLGILFGEVKRTAQKVTQIFDADTGF